jgi:16S rRNA G966 N2-methylase RsmD
MAAVLVAETHSSEYLIHKYWSRKPANVVRALIERYTRPGDLVIDPFCGSGVTLIEAARLGRRSVGIDVNPIAALLTRVSVTRIDLTELRRHWKRLLEAWLPSCRRAYPAVAGRSIRHCVHTALIPCGGCDQSFRADQCPKERNRYRCPACGAALNTSIAHASGTVVTAVQLGDGTLVTDPAIVAAQTEASARWCCPPAVRRRFDVPLVPNRRILAYAGMSTATLFTPRNFSLLARFADLIHDANLAAPIRDALLVVLTSAVASCSRLIAYRGNMAGGGPAWTVPGFWVPPVHLERNPFTHLAARFRKVERGLAALQRGERPEAAVYPDDAADRLERLHTAGTRAQYIFADPPYGDSVPFLEFCQIWNCWDPRATAALDREVVVSDRDTPPSDWEDYASRLATALRRCNAILAADGHLTLTFNNLELRAWHALLRAVQEARLWCVDVMYQVPAVVSAKARFAPSSSYLGDVYATFTKAHSGMVYRPFSEVERRLAEAHALRGGAVSRVSQLRVAALTILEQNVRAECIHTLERAFAALPARTPPIPSAAPLFTAIRGAIAERPALDAPERCAHVIARLPMWLGLDQHEIVDVARRAGLAIDTRVPRRRHVLDTASGR